MIRHASSIFPKGTSHFASYVSLRIALDFCYIFFVAPNFSNHFLLPLSFDFSVTNYLSSLALLIVGLLVSTSNPKTFEGIVFFAVLTFVFVPLTTVYGLDSSKSALPVLSTLLAMGIVSGIQRTKFARPLKLPMVNRGPQIAIGTAITFVLLTIGWSIISGATSYLNFRFDEIYLFRRDASSVLNVGPMAYVNLWTQKFFNLFLFCLALQHRKFHLAALTFLIQLYFFGITSHRALIFMPVLAICVWYIYYQGWALSRLTLALSVALPTILGITLFFDYDELGSVILRRAFFVPASATYEWFSFFAENPHVFWSDNLLSSINNNRYSGTSLPFFLGNYFAFGKGVSFNNGLVSTGFAHAGFIGIIGYSIIFGLIVKLFDIVISNNAPVWIVAATMVSSIRTVWADSDLFAALLTHGLFIGLFSLWLYGGGVLQQQRTNTHFPRYPRYKKRSGANQKIK